VLGIVKDATGTFSMAFVFLVALAWLCAGLALSMKTATTAPGEPGAVDGSPAVGGRGAVGAAG
jgi:hypothetical protein